MKSLKFILIFIFHLSLLTNTKAQTDSAATRKAVCDKIMNMYTYVFQGKIISSPHVARIKTGAHTSSDYNFYLVQVQKVIKGDIKIGTIEIISGASNGAIYYDNGEIDRIRVFDRGSNYNTPPAEGIYFSYKDKIASDSTSVNTNSKHLEFDGAIPLHNGAFVKQEKGINRYFSTLSDFYDYISANYGVKIEQ